MQSAAPPAIVPRRYGLISITFFTVCEAGEEYKILYVDVELLIPQSTCQQIWYWMIFDYFDNLIMKDSHNIRNMIVADFYKYFPSMVECNSKNCKGSQIECKQYEPMGYSHSMVLE